MKLKFEAESNAKNEVTDLCTKLLGLTLPSGGKESLGGKIFLTPPGPNPWGSVLVGERISIDIGNKWLYLSNIVVNDVTVEYENRMSAGGPIGALVTIDLSTYELMTKSDIDKAFNASIVGATNTSSILNKVAVGGALSGVSGAAAEMVANITKEDLSMGGALGGITEVTANKVAGFFGG